MGKLLKLWLLGLLLATGVQAQNTRWDLIATTTAGTGQAIPLLALPGAIVTFYNEPGMTLASTYNSATSVSACPSFTQVVPNGTASCVGTADTQGNFGAWFVPGQYAYTLRVGASIYGPFSFTIGGTGIGSGVASLNSLTGALTIACGSGLSCNTAGSTITISAVCSPFNISSFSGGSTVELGATVLNPAFTASYSCPPNSASITNTDAIDSPLTLTTPFTSGTVVGSFTHSAVAATTFTLSAIQASTQTATQTINWEPRSFGGVGTAGATSSVTASGTTAILSTSDVLASIDLAASNVGQVYGPFTPSGQNVYLLLIGGSHTFIDTGTGFPFAFNAPIAVTFVNAHGVTVSMFLYQSTNPLFGTYNIRVAS